MDLSPLPAAEPCPAPLAWMEVVRSVREQTQSLEVETPAALLRVDQFGDGPPLVLLPDRGGNSLLYCLTAWLLKDDFRCILLNHPVWKSAPSIRELLPETATAYGLAIEHVAGTGAPCYGPGWGGLAALQLLRQQPFLAGPVILQSTGWQQPWTRTENLALGIGSHLPGSIRRVPGWQAAQIENHRRWFPPFDETRFGFLLDQLGRTPTRDWCNRQRSAALQQPGNFSAMDLPPVLLIRCEGDGAALQAASGRLEKSLPHARVEDLALCGHYPYLTHPHRLVKILRTFLDSCRSELRELPAAATSAGIV